MSPFHFSIAPNAHSQVFCVSLMVATPVIFMPAYGTRAEIPKLDYFIGAGELLPIGMKTEHDDNLIMPRQLRQATSTVQFQQMKRMVRIRDGQGFPDRMERQRNIAATAEYSRHR